jgi:hypothetical protein
MTQLISCLYGQNKIKLKVKQHIFIFFCPRFSPHPICIKTHKHFSFLEHARFSLKHRTGPLLILFFCGLKKAANAASFGKKESNPIYHQYSDFLLLLIIFIQYFNNDHFKNIDLTLLVAPVGLA